MAALTAAGARVVVVAPSKDPDLILGAMRAGAQEFVLDRDEAELRRAVASQAPVGGGGGTGELITVFPTRGGVGATTVAVNLAGALQRRGNDTCLLDFDLYLGDVLSFLDLPGRYSITDVSPTAARLDRELLDTSLARHASGLRVLAQSGKVEEAESGAGRRRGLACSICCAGTTATWWSTASAASTSCRWRCWTPASTSSWC